MAGDAVVLREERRQTGSVRYAALEPASGEEAWSVVLDGAVEAGIVTRTGVSVTMREGVDETETWTTVALDAATGDRLLTLPAAPLATEIVAAGGTSLYAAVRDRGSDLASVALAMAGLDPATGSEIWRVPLDPADGWFFEKMAGDVLVLRGYLAGAAAGTVTLMALDAASGDEVWMATWPPGARGTPGLAVGEEFDLREPNEVALLTWTDEVAGTLTVTPLDLATGRER